MRELARLELDAGAFATRYGPWAVIAGASDGTGACFAEQLAEIGVNLVLVARREAVLDDLGKRLQARHGIDYRVVVQDLSEAAAGVRLVAATNDLDVGLYISNAGTDGSGFVFLDEMADRAHRLIRMNVTTLIDAVHGFGRRMRARGRGGVIVMASSVGLGGQAMLSMYSSTKGFEINFAEALWAEWQAANIDVIAIAAPLMKTPALEKATAGTPFDMETAFDAADVTHNALAGLLAREPLQIIADGPNADKLAQLQTDRKERTLAFLEFSKSFRN